PGYFPDLVPTDFHIFRSLQNSLAGKNLNNFRAIKRAVSSAFSDESEDFYERRITQVPRR
ncbi:Histone-lysine N-methyltransferase SETMAR, partial [Habropoda laboriosa]